MSKEETESADEVYEFFIETCRELEEQGHDSELIDGILLGVLATRMESRNEIQEFKILLRHAINSFKEYSPPTIH